MADDEKPPLLPDVEEALTETWAQIIEAELTEHIEKEQSDDDKSDDGKHESGRQG